MRKAPRDSMCFAMFARIMLQACRTAHANLRPAVLSWAEGEVHGVNINRSPTAYLNNPEDEQAQYKYDVDKDMVVLKIETNQPQPARYCKSSQQACTIP